MGHPENLPNQPDLLAEERGLGGKMKRRVFARLVWQGMDPYEAFLRADYPVQGVNSRAGHTPLHARARAKEMAESPWCKDWALGWSMDPKEQVKSAVPEAIALLVEGLADRTCDGKVTGLAVRCAENLLDRGGVIRSQKVETEETSHDAATKDAKALIRMIKERLEQLEGPVRKPPALEAITLKAPDIKNEIDPADLHRPMTK